MVIFCPISVYFSEEWNFPAKMAFSQASEMLVVFSSVSESLGLLLLTGRSPDMLSVGCWGTT